MRKMGLPDLFRVGIENRDGGDDGFRGGVGVIHVESEQKGEKSG